MPRGGGGRSGGFGGSRSPVGNRGSGGSSPGLFGRSRKSPDSSKTPVKKETHNHYYNSPSTQRHAGATPMSGGAGLGSMVASGAAAGLGAGVGLSIGNAIGDKMFGNRAQKVYDEGNCKEPMDAYMKCIENEPDQSVCANLRKMMETCINRYS